MPTGIPTIGWPEAPILILTATAIVVLLADVISAQRSPYLSLLIALVGMFATLAVIAGKVPTDASAFGEFLQYDPIGRWGAMAVIIGGCLVGLVSIRTVQLYELPPAEYFALLVFAVSGMVVLCVSVELFTIFLAVEVIAFSFYVLVGLTRGSTRSSEASLKYFILSAFSGGFLLYGFVFLYGSASGNSLVGKIGISIVQNHFDTWVTGCFILGLSFALAGFAFKLTLAPFHLYAADVFEGAPTPVSALLATGSKVAGFVALIHVLSPLRFRLGDILQQMPADVETILWVLAAVSIIVGNLVALLQRNVKRMLAYSSVAHGGYLLIAGIVFVHGPALRIEVEKAIVIYVAAYILMNVAAFGVAATLGRRGEGDMEDYAGLAQQSPWLAAAMAVSMLSLTGIPATLGFVGKFYVFARAVESGYIILVVIAVLGSAVSAYYYLRVVVFMYMRDPTAEAGFGPTGLIQNLGLWLTVAPIVVFGVLPQWLVIILNRI